MDATLPDDAAELQRLCDAGEATKGAVVRVERGAIEVGRLEATDIEPERRFGRLARLLPLSPGQYGLSIVRHTGRLERVPFSGTVAELHDTMESVLGHIFDEW